MKKKKASSKVTRWPKTSTCTILISFRAISDVYGTRVRHDDLPSSHVFKTCWVYNFFQCTFTDIRNSQRKSNIKERMPNLPCRQGTFSLMGLCFQGIGYLTESGTILIRRSDHVFRRNFPLPGSRAFLRHKFIKLVHELII